MGKWLSPMKAAAYADMSINIMKPYMRDGTIPAYRKPWNQRYLLVNTDDVDAWIRTWKKASEPVDGGDA